MYSRSRGAFFPLLHDIMGLTNRSARHMARSEGTYGPLCTIFSAPVSLSITQKLDMVVGGGEEKRWDNSFIVDDVASESSGEKWETHIPL